MRTPRTSTVMIILGLLLATSATALAQGAPEGTPAGGSGASREEQPRNGTEQQQAAQDRVAELKAARAGVLERFHAARSAIVGDYLAALNATRASFLAAKAELLAACSEARAGSTNASETRGPPEHAKCVGEGIRQLIANARAENAAARETAQQKLAEERDTGMASWGKARQDADARYESRAGGRAPSA